MAAQKVHDEGQMLGAPTGKTLGIVDTRKQFDTLVKALETAGFNRNYYFHGDEGIQLLERVNTFFFSDMEERVLSRHIDELKAGHAIIAIETPADRREEVVQLATQHGARRLVHFGLTTVTWLSK
jgi:hypothetical protein